MELVRCKITENGDTALHIAASAKAPKEKVVAFVKNLVERMTPEDLKLLNNSESTALYLAAAAGNIETVKIMMEANQEWMEKNQESMEKNWESMEKNRKSMEKNRKSMEKNRELMEKNRELTENNRELMDTNRELMRNNQTLMEDNRELMEDNRVLIKNNRKLTEKNRQLTEKNRKLTEKNRKLTENKRKLTENNGKLTENKRKLTENNEKLTENNRELTENNGELTRKNGDLMQNYEELMQNNRELELIKKNRKSMEKNRELMQKNEELMQKNGELMEKNRKLMENNLDLDTIPGGGDDMMPLYVAVLFGNKDVAEYLYESSKGLLNEGWTDENRSSLLEKCVESDMFDIAIKIVEKYPELGRSSNLLGLLARKPEAFREKESNIIKRTIKSVSAFIGDKAGAPVEKNDAQQLLRNLWGNIVTLSKKKMSLILRGPQDSIGYGKTHQTKKLKDHIITHLDGLDIDTQKTIMEVSKLRSRVDQYVEAMHLKTREFKQDNDEDQNLELQKLISENIGKLYDETNKYNTNSEHEARELKSLISNHIRYMRYKTEVIDVHYSSRLMFIAAEVGNTNFLLELIRTRPDLIWKRNDYNQTIFHVAVKHRHEGIYNLLYEIGSMKDMVTPIKDDDGNNLLHLAAMSTRKKNLEDVSGAALQMQRELLWFKEVERMVPPSLRESKNKDGFTPRELFTMEHQHLIAQGEAWMKSTASQCMVVAALIATIVFAAAFTVPGGYHQDNGFPMFKRKKTFVAFVVADAVSLFLSSASILTFLSILTSRYAERDFVASLPKKLMLGLTTLFLSIGAMMVTFSVSFFVLYHKGMKWIPIVISILAIIPAILYVALQYHVLKDVFRSTYGGKYLFKPTRQVLFYENPKV